MSERIDQAIWKKTITSNGFDQTTEGQLTEDPFILLATRVANTLAANDKYPVARVNLGLTNGADYGTLKVHVSLTIPVLPMEADISLAGEAAFIKARQMVNEASAALGLEPLG